MSERKIRVLVTGANGFLGRNILLACMPHLEIEAIAACRTPEKLIPEFKGEIRKGDLMDAGYRKSVVQDVDVICHTGTWASMWGHKNFETTHFYIPTVDLIERSIESNVGRFLMTSTNVITSPSLNNIPVNDFSPGRRNQFWPHLNRLIDVDEYMRKNSDRGTKMVTMRLGHFVGKGNTLGLVPALAPRLRTHLVPWLAQGRSRMSLIADTDLGQSFVLAALADKLNNYESFNICGSEFPTTREVVSFICEETGLSKPHFSVPFTLGYVFAWLMETLHPILPGSSPFLTRSIVHLSEDWLCSTDYATKKIGYIPKKDWRVAVREALIELKANGYAWPKLSREA